MSILQTAIEVSKLTITDTLYTPADVSKLINVPIGTLAYWRHAGQGPRFLKLGGRVIRYRKTDVAEWLNDSVQNTNGGAA